MTDNQLPFTDSTIPNRGSFSQLFTKMTFQAYVW